MNKFVFSTLTRMWHCLHVHTVATTINQSPARRAHNSKPAAVGLLLWAHAEIHGHYRFIDPASHTMQTSQTQTDMLIRLGFSTISHNAEWTFMKQSSLCNYRLVSIVRDICMYDTRHVSNTWSLILSMSVRFHLSIMCLSVFLYFLVLSVIICLLFLWAMPPESK